ncbi:MAG: HAD-IIB family hydrolase [Lachnospiraceae bacterium]|nr:HAD-IIB family hydrolase [Lachnospiraceae bacterium]
MKKLFASDFDNTLYIRNEGILPKTADVIRRFQEAGNIFGICTGRPVKSPRQHYEGVLDPDFIIGSSGGAIIDRDGKTLFERTMPYELVRNLERMGRERSFAMAVHADGRFILIAEDETAYAGMERIASIETVRDLPMHGISFLTGSLEGAKAFADEILAAYPDRVSIHLNRSAVDVAAAGCSKGIALRKIAEIFGADRTYGMGDSLNDLPLVKSADVGFTFAEAPEELKAAARHIVGNAADAFDIALEDQ